MCTKSEIIVVYCSKDISVKEKVLALEGKILGCWCTPERCPPKCHKHTYIKSMKELRNNSK